MKKTLMIGALSLVLLGGAAAGGTALALTQAPHEALVAVRTAVLKQGSSGGEEKEVHRRPKNWGNYSGAGDGVFGTGTKTAGSAKQQKKRTVFMKPFSIRRILARARRYGCWQTIFTTAACVRIWSRFPPAPP